MQQDLAERLLPYQGRSHQPRVGYGEKSAEAIVLTVNELQIEIAEASLS